MIRLVSPKKDRSEPPKMKRHYTTEELMEAKARQEARRARRLQELYTPEELWKRQQEALAALEKLRPAPASPRDQRRADMLRKGTAGS